MKKKFIIGVKEVHVVNYTVEAEDKERALDMVENMLMEGEPDSEPVYDYTLDREDWGIHEAK